VIPLATAAEKLMYFTESKSPHGVDLSPAASTASSPQA
jgi:hypothetical protein